jgi:hypothetical protein
MKNLMKSWNRETSSKFSINYAFLPIRQYNFFNEEFWSHCQELLQPDVFSARSFTFQEKHFDSNGTGAISVTHGDTSIYT